MNVKKVEVRKPIGPKKIVHDGDIYRIINYPEKYFIKGYHLTIIDGKIENVFVNGSHPNAEPSTGKFCIPNELRKMDFNTQTKKLLETI